MRSPLASIAPTLLASPRTDPRGLTRVTQMRGWPVEPVADGVLRSRFVFVASPSDASCSGAAGASDGEAAAATGAIELPTLSSASGSACMGVSTLWLSTDETVPLVARRLRGLWLRRIVDVAHHCLNGAGRCPSWCAQSVTSGALMPQSRARGDTDPNAKPQGAQFGPTPGRGPTCERQLARRLLATCDRGNADRPGVAGEPVPSYAWSLAKCMRAPSALLQRAGVPFLVGGGFAVEVYLDAPRAQIKDLETSTSQTARTSAEGAAGSQPARGFAPSFTSHNGSQRLSTAKISST